MPCPPEMSKMDLKSRELYNDMLRVCWENPSCNSSLLLLGHHNGSGAVVYGLNFPGDGAPWLRTLISLVYFLVATAGMVGNLLVMFLLYSTRTISAGTINYFVFHLALAQLLFSLALPFWAVDAALADWRLGPVACVGVHVIYTVNLYGSVLILAFISLDRYLAVVRPTDTNTGGLRQLLASRLVYAGKSRPPQNSTLRPGIYPQ